MAEPTNRAFPAFNSASARSAVGPPATSVWAVLCSCWDGAEVARVAARAHHTPASVSSRKRRLPAPDPKVALFMVTSVGLQLPRSADEWTGYATRAARNIGLWSHTLRPDHRLSWPTARIAG